MFSPYAEACERLQAAKVAEEQARADRIDAEQAVIALAGDLKPEGATTVRDGQWKVTVTTVVNRRLDEAALDAVRQRLPAALFEQAVRFKPEPVLAGVRYLQNNEPDAYAVLADALIATPGKPQVRVEFVAEAKRAA